MTATKYAYLMPQALFKAPLRSSAFMAPKAAVRMSVACNDMATFGSEQHWMDVGNDYAARYPFTGGVSSYNPCLYWGAPVTTRPALAAAARAGPLLILQSRYDAQTPVEGAQATLNALPNASLIVVENEYKHGLSPYGVNCVDAKVADYFVNGAMPPRTSSCAGKPLPADSAARVSPMLKAEPALDAYTDPAQAQEIMRRIHTRIGEGKRGL